MTENLNDPLEVIKNPQLLFINRLRVFYDKSSKKRKADVCKPAPAFIDILRKLYGKLIICKLSTDLNPSKCSGQVANECFDHCKNYNSGAAEGFRITLGISSGKRVKSS